jgi:CSLREA domain-containing protein
VNSAADPGDGRCDATECTLREAIKDPAATEIRFAPGVTGPITLASPAAGGGTLRIDRSVTITGPSSGIVIRRRGADPAFRIMRIGPNLTVSLGNLTLRGGKSDLGGGGLINYGTLALANCRVTDNQTARQGGGIDNYGPLTLSNSVVARNLGGGIANHDDMTVTLTNSTVTRNTGPGIVDNSGSLVIRNSAITYNTADGIAKSRETVELDHVRVVGNGGGVSLFNADMTADRSTFAENRGRGITVYRAALTLTRSTVANNQAGETSEGGGIYARAIPRAGVVVRLTNSTVSGNSAGIGGGIYLEDDTYGAALLYLVNTTVAFNTATQSGGGIAQANGEEYVVLDFVNSILAQNSAPTAPDLRVGISDCTNGCIQVSSLYSLIGNGAGTGIPNEGGNLVGNVPPYTAPIDPLLGPLSRNGGATATHALLDGSPAIDAGTADGCPATDQRGVPRPRGEACDMGSYERP